MTRSVPMLAAVLAAVLAAGCTSKEPDRSCPSGQERCDGQCVDPATYYVTDGNCGGCGISCGEGTCAGGACACGALALCPASNPRCSDLQADPLNCGGCGNDCPKANESCVGGSCACAAPYPDDCGTYCANAQTDRRNCGQCGHVCPHTNDVCTSGTCACPDGLPDVCGGTLCVNLATDPAHCGSCTTTCATGATCSNSSCLCPAGQTVCGTACVNTSTDEANCGSCGHVCPTGASCSSSACTSCPAGPIAGCQGACCAGGSSACCGSGACETQHSNGLGQHFYDCNPLYDPPSTTTRDAALAAADAWATGTTYDATWCDPFCIARQTASECAIWCYGGSNTPGRVKAVATTVCGGACPYAGYATWH